ncbi:MAG: PIN domain nuclease, a component of toxin-antitoxin system (PIN domain) [Chloroflexi bacterium]|nr:MAG: PIN domain nuclease, a component of toxin-antitoxin system (PIN domain) [Chloroflexota bacterium]
MSEVVLDASALLAVINNEPGGDRVTEVLYGAAISAVNMAEVLAKLVDEEKSEEALRSALGSFPVTVVPFDEEQAYLAGLLRQTTRSQGLSLGDCSCLALAHSLGLPAFTADRAWSNLNVGVEVILVR